MGQRADELLESNDEGSGNATTAASRLGPFFGSSPEMRELYGMLRHVAPTTLALLVQGDGGCKQEVARAVHAAGPRAHGPFEIVDLATSPVECIGPALFGRPGDGGAQDVGAFARANRGTLFIDEIHRLPPELQPQLLGVLEHRRISLAGDGTPLSVDARVITATSRDLWLEVEARRFREDLYFRLAQVRVTVPSSSFEVEVPFAVAKQKVVDRFEKEYLGHLMQQTRGNISRAAREAELARHHLRDLLKKHGLYEGGDGHSTIPPRSK